MCCRKLKGRGGNAEGGEGGVKPRNFARGGRIFPFFLSPLSHHGTSYIHTYSYTFCTSTATTTTTRMSHA